MGWVVFPYPPCVRYALLPPFLIGYIGYCFLQVHRYVYSLVVDLLPITCIHQFNCHILLAAPWSLISCPSMFFIDAPSNTLHLASTRASSVVSGWLGGAGLSSLREPRCASGSSLSPPHPLGLRDWAVTTLRIGATYPTSGLWRHFPASRPGRLVIPPRCLHGESPSRHKLSLLGSGAASLLRATHVALAAYLDSPFGAGGSHGRFLFGVSAHQPCRSRSAGGACRCHYWVGHYLMSLFSSFSPHLILASLGFDYLPPWWVCLSHSSSLLSLFLSLLLI